MADDARLIRMSDVQERNPEFIWYPYLPKGYVSVIQGDGGNGKTYLWANLAAIISTGRAFPNEPPHCSRNPANVLFITGEDGLNDVLKKRFREAGADCTRVFAIDEGDIPMTLTDSRLESFMEETQPALLVFDPLQNFLGANVDMHRANEIRPVMSKLGRTAERFGCAIVLIGHMNKQGGGNALYRGLGSVDIMAACRSVLGVGGVPKAPHGEDWHRAIVHIKSNLAPKGAAVLYDTNPAEGFAWCGVDLHLTADEVMTWQPASTRAAPVSTRAEQLLNEMLSGGDLIPQKDILAEANRCCIGERTLDEVKLKLGVVSEKIGRKAWGWRLPKAV